MNIKELFGDLDISLDFKIDSLFTDSREKVSNGIFFCIAGLTHDSHNYVEDAIKNGAVCIVHEKRLDELKEKYKDILFIKVSDTRESLSIIAEKFFNKPSSKLNVYAVTGTNGKTSISYLIYYILSKFEKTAYNGTAGTIIVDEELPYTHLTTPDTIDLAKIFKKTVEKGAKSISIEVSSHALDMKRASAIDFDLAIFTNLSRDHLDYHGDMDSYKNAKAELFRNLKDDGIAILNCDEAEFEYFKDACGNSRVLSYGKSNNADYRFHDIELGTKSTKFKLTYKEKTYDIQTNLLSEIYVYNLTAVIASIHQMGKRIEDIIEICKDFKFEIGRFQYVKSNKSSVIVDYAHTPDAFEKIYAFSDTFRKNGVKVISVFGSAGKRDKGKRPIMGRIASEHSDLLILTEEDYRDEDPVEIARDIASGVQNKTEVMIEVDREKAIKLAFENSTPNDLILILGKGTEKFLDRGNKSLDWASDTTIAERYGN